MVEAMASSLPVITGKSGGVCETVVHGETGILFAPGDVKAHADALLKLGTSHALRVSMGNAGRIRAERKFSIESERKRLHEIIRKVSFDFSSKN